MNTSNGPLGDAFEALKTYDAGSSRASLQLIDVAVADASADLKGAATRELERSLITSLQEAKFAPAQEYAISKLRQLGSGASVPALAALLSDARLSGPARTALEAIPHEAASRALREALDNLHGPQKIGAIHSLGVRRDKKALDSLATLLNSEDAQIASAAAFALGEIGVARAAKSLAERLGSAPAALKPALYDAALTCLEQLENGAQESQAKALRQALGASEVPKHVRDAAAKGSVT